MITIHSAMLVILGFLLAALLLLVFLPAYRRRIERFTSETIKRSLPLTETEIRADKDRIRAEYAIELHKLDMKVEESSLAAARQSVEINRREAKIHALEQAIDTQKMNADEHENARRVLEQAIMDRLPKVEQRLGEARQLLVQRDREIAILSESSTKQTEAIQEATQINIQQADELRRARSALETRAARNRETRNDARFDGEVALRTEVETLRTKARDQAALIERLQTASEAASAENAALAYATGDVEQLRSALAKAEAELNAVRAGESSDVSARQSLAERSRQLEVQLADQTAEFARLKSSLKVHQDAAAELATGKQSETLANAQISALQAELEEQRRIIQTLRTEVAGSNERLSRQAQHFREELRKFGASAQPATSSPVVRPVADQPRRSLAERIAQPRVPSTVEQGGEVDAAEAVEHVAAHKSPSNNGSGGEVRQSGFLRALNGGAKSPTAPASASVSTEPQTASVNEATEGVENAPRRARLLDRIGNLDKS